MTGARGSSKGGRGVGMSQNLEQSGKVQRLILEILTDFGEEMPWKEFQEEYERDYEDSHAGYYREPYSKRAMMGQLDILQRKNKVDRNKIYIWKMGLESWAED